MIIGVVALSIFIPKVIFASVVKFTKRNFLTISKDGIRDTSELYSVGFMPWKDIQEIVVTGKNSRRRVEIRLKTYEKVMTEISWIKRFMLRLSKMAVPSSIVLNFDYSDKSFDEALKVIDKNSREYMRRKVQYRSIY